MVSLEEIEYALTQQIHDDANMPTVVEAITEVDAPIPIVRIVCFQGGEDPELDSRGISVFLHRADDFDGHQLVLSSVSRLNDFPKGALAQQFDDLIWHLLDKTVAG